MTALSTIVDGYGQVGTRVYASLSDAPAARIGAIIAVDDGTAGTFYEGIDVGGTPTWAPIATLADITDDDTGLVSKTPTSGNPNHVNTNSHLGLILSGQFTSINADVTDSNNVIYAQQSAVAAVSEPAVVLQRHTQSTAPLLRTVPTGGSSGANIDVVNGFGEITARIYDTLPAASADHYGAIVLVTTDPDVFYMCIHTPLGYVWAQFQGPPGATGSAPVIGTPTISTLAAGSSATVSQSGSGTSGDPYIDHFGIPRGDTGATGATGIVDFPNLPNPGDPTLTFQMPVFALGTFLPWKLPQGYGFRVISAKGLWEWENPGADVHASSALSDSTAGMPSGSAYYNGRMLFSNWSNDSANDSVLTRVDSSEHDAFTTYTVGHVTGETLSMYMNTDSGYDVKGYVIANIQISPAAPVNNPEVFDFTTGPYSFNYEPPDTSVDTIGTGVQASGGSSYISWFCGWLQAGVPVTRMRCTFFYAPGLLSAVYFYVVIGRTIVGAYEGATVQSDNRYAVWDQPGLSVVTQLGNFQDRIGVHCPIGGLTTLAFQKLEVYFSGAYYPVSPT